MTSSQTIRSVNPPIINSTYYDSIVDSAVRARLQYMAERARGCIRTQGVLSLKADQVQQQSFIAEQTILKGETYV